MSITLKIKGLDAAIKNANKIASTARKETQAALDDFAFRVEGDAKVLAPANEGGLRMAIGTKRGNLQASVVVAKDYAAFMEFGTRKYAAQYVATLPAEWKELASEFKGNGNGGSIKGILFAMRQWFKDKGIDDDYAFFIARKMLREGVRPHPFLYPAVNANLDQLKKDLNNVIK